MTADELLDDYCHEMELIVPPDGSEARRATVAMIESALQERPDIASGAELIDWLMSEDEP